MKIGIITHWKDQDNYGAALQSYALQKYLQLLGHDAFIIRYYPKRERNKLPRRILNFLKNPLILLELIKQRKLARRHAVWNRLRNFDVFRNLKVVLSLGIYHGYEELIANPPIADLYITGSDQVWHGTLEDKQNRAFFLDFGPKHAQRISYAASFGRNYFPCVDKTLFKKLLSAFNGISMREKSGITILKDMGIESIHCLDSTLLLSYEHYKSLIVPRKHNIRYVYFYLLNVTSPSEVYWSQIRRYFEKQNLQCIVTTGSGYKKAEEIFNKALYDYSTVEEWLTNIYYSDLVVTASFHGIIFAYVLRKNFIYMPLQGKYAKGNDRVTELLESVGLSNRIASSWNDVIRITAEPIDYNNLNNEEFNRLRNNSIEFLNQFLSKNNISFL